MVKPTVRDIAKKAGVSPASVSRALQGVPGVSEQSRQHILAVASEMGYNFFHAHLADANSASKAVILFVRNISNPFYAGLIDSACSALSSYGYQPLVIPHKDQNGDIKQALGDLSSFCVQGLVLLMAFDDPAVYISELSQLACPSVLLLNRPIDGFKGNCVIQDNLQAGYTATRHLIELGHKRIAYLNGPCSAPAFKDRQDGYCRALENYGIAFSQSLLFEGDLTMQSGILLAKEFLRGEQPLPDALICSNDLMALGFLDEFRKKGHAIPEEISLMGFDDIPFASLAGIDLTTMRQLSCDMGRRAVELLHKKITQPDSENETVIFDPQLIVRKTTIQRNASNRFL